MTKSDWELSVDSISVSYEGVVALYETTLIIRKGSIVRVKGPNGSGKTTLLDVISGYVRPNKVTNTGSKAQSPVVRLGEDDLLRLATHEIALKGVGRTFQRQDPPLDLTVGECLDLVTGDTAKFMRRFARTAGLLQFTDTVVAELSGGYRRLLKIACAIGMGSRVLLLDEPFAGIDLQKSQQIIASIHQRSRAGVIVIFVEHNSRSAQGSYEEWQLTNGKLEMPASRYV